MLVVDDQGVLVRSGTTNPRLPTLRRAASAKLAPESRIRVSFSRGGGGWRGAPVGDVKSKGQDHVPEPWTSDGRGGTLFEPRQGGQ